MYCLEHTECPAWNTGNVLLGTQEMFCLEHTTCFVCNTGNLVFGAQEMSCTGGGRGGEKPYIDSVFGPPWREDYRREVN